MALSGIVSLLSKWTNISLHVHGDYIVHNNTHTKVSISHSFIQRMSLYDVAEQGQEAAADKLIESFKDRRVIEEAAILMKSEQYDEARQKLKEAFQTGPNKVHNLLQIIECDVYIDDVELLKNDVRVFQSELCQSQITYDEIRNLAMAYFAEDCFIGAAFLFHGAKESAVLQDDPHGTIIRISKLVRDLRTMVEEIFRKEFGTKRQSFRHILPLLKDLLSDIHRHKRAHSIKDPAIIKSVAQCIYDIAQCYGFTGQREAFLDLNLEACAYLRGHFHREADKLKLLGRCLNNAGVAYDMLGEDEKALAKFSEAIVVYHSATDWFNTRERKMDERNAESNLSQMRVKISEASQPSDDTSQPDTT